MAVKTITIDMEAYELLARQKRKGQSFSEIIKEHFRQRKTASQLLEALPTLVPGAATLDRIETQVKRRSKDQAKAPRL